MVTPAAADIETHPNVVLMRKVYEAFTKGDVESAAAYWTDDCVHHYPGRSPLSGSHQGIESANAFAGKMFELTRGRIQMSIEEVGASESYAFALVQTRYQRDGKPDLSMRFINVSLIRDGKIAVFWTYPDDQYAVDEFWS
jgi:ketosteroid isomerase-like protein